MIYISAVIRSKDKGGMWRHTAMNSAQHIHIYAWIYIYRRIGAWVSRGFQSDRVLPSDPGQAGLTTQDYFQD